MNSKAEVIGINTAIIRGSQGIGFAVNLDYAETVIAQLMERGYVNRGFLGISPFNLSPHSATPMGAPVSGGVLVAQVVPDSAAASAGLRAEDIIVELEDFPIPNTGQLSKFLIAHPPGETVTVVFYRKSEEKTIQLTLGERSPG